MDVALVVDAYWDELVAWLPRLALAVAFLVIGAFVGSIARRFVLATMRRGRFISTHQTFFAGVARWLMISLGAMAALDVVGLGGLATGLMAGGGVTAVVLGFAFREIGENMLAGVLLAFSRPFEVGDYVQSGDVEGSVVDLDLRTVHVRTIDARDIWIPSSQVINQPFVNYTLDGLRRPSFLVGIDYGDDAGQACRSIQQALVGMHHLLPDRPPVVVVKAFEGAWVNLQVSFWVDTNQIDVTVAEVTSAVMERTRVTLREGGYTLSSDTSAVVALKSADEVRLRVAP